MKSNLSQDWLKEMDRRIRSGQMLLVREQLSQLSAREVPDSIRSELSHLLVRVGLAHRAISVLSPAIRIGSELREKASPKDRLAYAFALAKIGSSREAISILKDLPKDIPEAHLYQGYIYQTQWNFADAVPFIRQYLELSKNEPYEAAIARVNLLACMVNAQDFVASEQLLFELRKEAEDAKWELVQVHLNELEAQIAIGRNEWERAEKVVRKTQGGNLSIERVSDLLLAKWAAWIRSHRGDLTGGLAALEHVRRAAHSMAHWETIRDCDRMQAELTRDHQLLARVYVGTPHETFRAKLADRCRSWAVVPQVYLLGEQPGPILDLETGEMSGATEELKPGQIVHRCLMLLFRDFYRPITLGQLFGDLFPSQYFNPGSSPNRVYNVLRRVRNWAKINSLPLDADFNDHAYFIKPWQSGFTVRVLAPKVNSNLELDGRLKLVRSKLDLDEFTSDDVAKVLQVSRSSAVRLLNRAVEGGALNRQGARRATTYRWAA